MGSKQQEAHIISIELRASVVLLITVIVVHPNRAHRPVLTLLEQDLYH